MLSSSNYDSVEETWATSRWAPHLRGHLGSTGFNISRVLDFPQAFRSFDSVTSAPCQSLSLELRYGQALALSVPEKPLLLGQTSGKYRESRYRQAVPFPHCPAHKRLFGITKFPSSFVSLLPSRLLTREHFPVPRKYIGRSDQGTLSLVVSAQKSSTAQVTLKAVSLFFHKSTVRLQPAWVAHSWASHGA